MALIRLENTVGGRLVSLNNGAQSSQILSLRGLYGHTHTHTHTHTDTHTHTHDHAHTHTHTHRTNHTHHTHTPPPTHTHTRWGPSLITASVSCKETLLHGGEKSA